MTDSNSPPPRRRRRDLKHDNDPSCDEKRRKKIFGNQFHQGSKLGGRKFPFKLTKTIAHIAETRAFIPSLLAFRIDLKTFPRPPWNFLEKNLLLYRGIVPPKKAGDKGTLVSRNFFYAFIREIFERRICMCVHMCVCEIEVQARYRFSIRLLSHR